MIFAGDTMPGIRLRGNANPSYALDTAAGRYLLLAFVKDGDGADEAVVAEWVRLHRPLFDDELLCFFGVISGGQRDVTAFADELPGVRWLFDDRELVGEVLGSQDSCWVVVDPGYRVLAVIPLKRTAEMQGAIANLPPSDEHGAFRAQAPVLLIPRIFESDFCSELTAYFDSQGAESSGFMREVDGLTRLVHDHRHKSRHDRLVSEGPLKEGARARLSRRLVPQIEKAFQFQATRIERYLVAAYDSAAGGWFRAHRDNTTRGTAHRRFAVSINLNSDFDGGDLRFPEFGTATYRPPPGGACVFSCSLLHEVTAVKRGRRYAFLPFLYDEAASRVREANRQFIETGTASDRAMEQEQHRLPASGPG